MNTFCNLSRKKSREVAASLPGRFLSRRCFTLCIRMEVELIIANIVQELCESRGGRPELSVLTSLLAYVDVKIY